MYPDLTATLYYDEPGARPTARYVRWLAFYLAVVILLWLVGLEGIYGHPTPFYALPQPAFQSILVPGTLLAAGALLYLITTQAIGHYTRRRLFTGAMLFLALVLVLAAQFYQELRLQNQSPAALISHYWGVLRWHLLALVVFYTALMAGLYVLNRIRWVDSEPDRRTVGWYLVGLVAFCFAFACAVAMIRGGVAGIAQAYARETYEYVGDIGKTRTIRDLFGRYLAVRPYLSMHAKVHPPGPIAVLWLLSFVAGREALALSLATISVGVLAIFPLYGWVAELTDRRTALVACTVYSVVPSIVLFTATSADILFMPFTLTTLFLFTRALRRGAILPAAAAGLGYALMSLLSFSLIAVGAYFGFMALRELLRARAGAFPVAQAFRRVLVTACVMGFAFLAAHAAVWYWFGFDMVACFQACKAQFDLDQHHLDLMTPRWPGWIWRFVNPACWLFFAGIPVSFLFIRRLRHPDPATRSLFLVFLLTLLVLNLLYLARGEGERSAMYVFPFLIVPAAHWLAAAAVHTRRLGPLAATLSFLAFQCWMIESYLFTYW